MRGGIKIYVGPPSATRHYVEAGRGRADDYYLIEGAGLARRYTASDRRVQELAALAGDGWGWLRGVGGRSGP